MKIAGSDKNIIHTCTHTLAHPLTHARVPIIVVTEVNRATTNTTNSFKSKCECLNKSLNARLIPATCPDYMGFDMAHGRV